MNFTWAVEANYPAGANPWNGQPLKVAPAGDYWLPGVKVAAEEMNFVFSAVSQNIISAVTSLANLRALPVPTGSGAVLCTPENTSQTISGIGSGIGGLYYYDPANTGPDNSSTTIQPAAVTGANPGRWRLQGGMCMIVSDVYQDSQQGGINYSFGVTLNTGTATATYQNSSSQPLSALGTTFVTGSSAGNMFPGDVIDLTAQVNAELTLGSGSTALDMSNYWTRNGTAIGAQIDVLTLENSGSGVSGMSVCQELKLRYVVTSGDIAAGTLTFDVVGHTSRSIGGSDTVIGTIPRFAATLRRF